MSLHLAAIKLRISGAKAECSRRGLGQTENWLSEISFDIRVRSFPRARKIYLSQSYPMENSTSSLFQC